MSNKITFIEHYDNRIKFISGYYSEPYVAVWEELSKDNSIIIKTEEISLGSKEYIVPTEIGKTYRLIIKDKKSSEEIESHIFYSGNLTIKEIIDQIIKTRNINKEKFLKEYNKLIAEINPIEWIDLINHAMQLYVNASNEEKMSFYSLLQGLIERYNYFSSSNNGEHVLLDNYFSTILFNSNCFICII